MRAHTHAHNNAKGPSACSRGVRRPLAGQEVGPRARGARAAALHVPPGRGGTLDDPDCPAAVRSGQWGSGAQDTQRSTAIATTTCLPRKVHIIVRISSRTQRGSPRSLPNSKDIASEVLERLEPAAACIERNLGVSIGECQGFSIERNAGARVLGSFQTIPTTHPRSLMRCARAEVSRGMAQSAHLAMRAISVDGGNQRPHRLSSPSLTSKQRARD